MEKDKLTDTVKAIDESREAAGAMTAEVQIERDVESKPRKWAGLLVRYFLPLCLTVALMWYMFHKVPFSEVIDIVSSGVNYWWILLAMGISVFSHIFRAARWRLQLKSLGVEVPFPALCCSIFGCYALNLVFPRLGEVWRCTYVAKRGNSHFTTVLGSMVSDRLMDTLSVLLLTVLTFIVAHSAIQSFLDEYQIGQEILSLAESAWFWVALVGGLGVIVLAFYLLRDVPVVRKLLGWFKELWQGVASLWHMDGKVLFFLLTVAIWGAYFVQLYVAFFAFDFTRALCAEESLAYGLVPCLVAFVLSSIGMAIPSNGGLGPWNIAVMFGLAIYKVSENDGAAFSILQWSGQTVMLILLGVFTMIYISLSSKRNKTPLEKND